MCTPLAPTPLYENVFGGPTARALTQFLGVGEMLVLGQPLSRFLAATFSWLIGCMAGVVALVGFYLATVFKWRSIAQADRQKLLEIEQARLELERERLALEKRRLDSQTEEAEGPL